MMTPKTNENQLYRQILPLVAAGTFHGLGILILAVIIFIPFVATGSWSVYAQAFSNPAFLSTAIWDVALHIGLAACTWTLGVILVRLWTSRTKTKTTFRATRGSIMLETLIVLVPLLLLTSGIAQLTILNVSGVLAHVASYQATRTVWIFKPDANKGRMGVGHDEVNRRARLAAAAVMAPTAPANYFVLSSSDPEFLALRGTMTGAFSINPSANAGTHGKSLAAAYIFGGSSAADANLSFGGAFDNSSFSKRAARKLTFAYAASKVTVSAGGTITTTLEYKQNIVFPWFSYLWGTFDVVGGRIGHYVTLTRTFSMPAQVSL